MTRDAAWAFRVHLNENVVAVIKQIESGGREIGLQNLDDPAFDRF